MIDRGFCSIAKSTCWFRVRWSRQNYNPWTTRFVVLTALALYHFNTVVSLQVKGFTHQLIHCSYQVQKVSIPDSKALLFCTGTLNNRIAWSTILLRTTVCLVVLFYWLLFLVHGLALYITSMTKLWVRTVLCMLLITRCCWSSTCTLLLNYIERRSYSIHDSIVCSKTIIASSKVSQGPDSLAFRQIIIAAESFVTME